LKPPAATDTVLLVLQQQGVLRGLDRGQVLLSDCARYPCQYIESINYKCVLADESRALHLTGLTFFILQDVLQKRPETPTLKHHVVDYLRDMTRSFAYTRNVMARLDIQAREEVARLGGNAALLGILDYMQVKMEPGDEDMLCHVQ